MKRRAESVGDDKNKTVRMSDDAHEDWLRIKRELDELGIPTSKGTKSTVVAAGILALMDMSLEQRLRMLRRARAYSIEVAMRGKVSGQAAKVDDDRAARALASSRPEVRDETAEVKPSSAG